MKEEHHQHHQHHHHHGEDGSHSHVHHGEKWHKKEACVEYSANASVNQLAIDMFTHICSRFNSQSSDSTFELTNWITKTTKVIDFGAGPAHVLALLTEYSDYVVSIDNSHAMNAIAYENLTKKVTENERKCKFDVLEWDLEQSSQEYLHELLRKSEMELFDVALCTLVAHHVKDLKSLHNTMCSVVKDDGFLVYFDMMKESESTNLMELASENTSQTELGIRHVHGLSTETFEDLAKNSDCTVVYSQPDLKFAFGSQDKLFPILAVYMKKNNTNNT